MITLVAEVECLLYHPQSLKEKRSIIKRTIARVRKDFNVSIAEVDYQSLWQRTKFGIAIVANEQIYADKVMQEVFRLIDNEPNIEITIASVERV